MLFLLIRSSSFFQMTAFGTCQAMCSSYECEDRQRGHGVHPLECTPETSRLPPSERIIDPARAVKQHVRTAEGRAEAPDQVRPLEWLRITVTYLTGEAQVRGLLEGFPLPVVYAFISDRLMAVRKDLVMQDLRGLSAIRLYEEIIRYLIIMGYLLGDKAPPDFDAHLNMGAVRSGLATLHSMYKEALTSGVPEPSLHNRDEFLSYQVLVHLLDVVRCGPLLGPDLGLDVILTLIPRGVVLNDSSWPLTLRAVKAVSALATGNYVRLLRFLATARGGGGSSMVCLHGCLLHGLLPQVRRRALDLFNKAAFFKDWTSMGEVARLLSFSDVRQAADFCALFSVPVKEDQQQQEVEEEVEGGNRRPPEGGGGGRTCSSVNLHRKVVLREPDVRSRERLQEVIKVMGCRQDRMVMGGLTDDAIEDWARVHRHMVVGGEADK